MTVSPTVDIERARRLREWVRGGLPPAEVVAAPPEIDPFDGVSVDALVAEAAASRRYGAALTLLTAAVAAGSAPARDGLARLGHAAGDPAAVLRAGESGGDGERMAWRAEALAAVGRRAEADALLVAAGKADPPLVDVGAWRARLWDPADPDGALRAWEEPGGAGRLAAVALRVRLMVAAGRLDEAEATLRAAEATWGGAYELLSARVTLATARGDRAAALAACDAMPGIGADGVRRQRARVLARFGDAAGALTAIAGDESLSAWEIRAEVLPEGERPAARERAVALDPASKVTATWATDHVATAPEQVRRTVREALDRRPGDPQLWAALARAETALGHPAAAATAWEEAFARGLSTPEAAAEREAALVAAGWREAGARGR